MPSRSVVTRENLSLDFEILPSNPGGPLRLRLNNAHFQRDPETGEISVIGSGGGVSITLAASDDAIVVSGVEGGYEVGLAISEAPGNAVEIRADGVFVPVAEAPPAMDVTSDNAGISVNTVEGGVAIGAVISGEIGNQIEMRGDGLYAGASAFETVPPVIETDYAILPDQNPNRLFMLESGVAEVRILEGVTYATGAEYTLVKAGGAFIVAIEVGVTLNGVSGPADFDVGALPDGVVLKSLGAGQWIALGDCALVE